MRCPLCGQPLSPDERSNLIASLETDGKDMGDRYRANLELQSQADGRVREVQTQISGLARYEEELRGLARQHDRLEAERLTPPQGDEVYLHELAGFAVRQEDGTPLGLVSDVYDLPGGLMLEVQGPEREFLLPYKKEFVRQVDRENRRLVVAFAAHGPGARRVNAAAKASRPASRSPPRKMRRPRKPRRVRCVPSSRAPRSGAHARRPIRNAMP